jgi:hypothetical protein
MREKLFPQGGPSLPPNHYGSSFKAKPAGA